MRIRSLLSLCLFFSSLQWTLEARAQSLQPDRVTVDQAVQEAIGKSLGLLAERYNLSVAEARVITARLRPHPVFSLEAGHLNSLLPGGIIFTLLFAHSAGRSMHFWF